MRKTNSEQASFRNSAIPRRKLLRGAGAALVGLPMLDAMCPAVSRRAHAQGEAQESPKRFLAACATLGFHGPHLFPDAEGKQYEPTPYLQQLADHAQDLTVFSGLSHPEQQGNNGHASELSWLTAAKRPGLAGFKNTISLDQLIAQRIGLETRFPYLALSTSGRSISWSSAGVEIPGEASPARLFKSLFIEGSESEVNAEVAGLQRGRSILDTVRGQASSLQGELGGKDRAKLDEYFTAIRELEQRLQQSQGWVRRPKPQVEAELPQDISDKNDAIARQTLMYEMIALALQTDSTRTVTLQLSGLNSVPLIPGVSSDWHGLSHHGKDPDKIKELRKIEQAEFNAFAGFLTRLKGLTENGVSMLDHTAILFGSNLGNASSHDWRNLPIIVAGGGFRHQGYVAHDASDNTPLANLFVTLAQRMGLEIDQFGSSTAAGLRGLDA